jgi:hypothetical protein
MRAALSHHPPGWPCMRLSRHDDVIARLGRQRSIDSRGGKASRANRATRREQFFCFSFGLQSSGFANGMLGMYFSVLLFCFFLSLSIPLSFRLLGVRTSLLLSLLRRSPPRLSLRRSKHRVDLADKRQTCSSGFSYRFLTGCVCRRKKKPISVSSTFDYISRLWPPPSSSPPFVGLLDA